MPSCRWAHEALVAQLRQGRAEHHPTGHHRQRHTSGLGYEWHRATRARIRFDDVHLVVGHCELHVDEPAHIERCCNFVHVFADGGQGLCRQRLGRQRTRRVTRVDACFFDVFHHTADEHLAGVVANGININLGGALQKTINEHRARRRQTTLAAERTKQLHLGHCIGKLSVIVHNAHGSPTEHIAGSHQHRITRGLRYCTCTRQRGGSRPRWLGDSKLVAQCVPLFAIFRHIN